MPLRLALFALAATTATSSALAQVTAVVTETTASIESGYHNQAYSGTDISGAVEAAEGDGGSFHASSQIEEDFILFRNGNSSSGNYARIFSRTIVDITFTNDTSRTVAPVLHSTITAEGMGFFVASTECLPDTLGCQPGDLNRSSTFQDFVLSENPMGDALVGSSFLFRITGGGQVMYELDGSVALVRDSQSGLNTIVTDIADAAAALSNFRLNSPEGSETEFGYAWDATNITVPFPDGTLLAPGESATLRYETITESFGNAIDLTFQDELLAYASFGDPVGRRGGIGVRSSFDESGLTYDGFRFNFPVFDDGVLIYTLEGFTPAVPEPATWATMLVGFGLVGGALRRRGSAREMVAERG